MLDDLRSGFVYKEDIKEALLENPLKRSFSDPDRQLVFRIVPNHRNGSAFPFLILVGQSVVVVKRKPPVCPGAYVKRNGTLRILSRVLHVGADRNNGTGTDIEGNRIVRRRRHFVLSAVVPFSVPQVEPPTLRSWEIDHPLPSLVARNWIDQDTWPKHVLIRNIPRIWIGLTGSITPLRLLHTNASGNLQDAAGDALLATNNSGWVGGGLTLHVRITKSFWINVGGIYRYVGYDWMFNTTDLNEDAFAERSRLRMIDIPLLVRYTGKKWNPSKYTFYELGGTYRDVFSRVTTADQTAFASTAGIGPGISSGTAYHRTSYGATVGAGLIAKDDFGIIVSPEVRYTRWMGDTLGSNVIGTQKNQLEITLTFGF